MAERAHLSIGEVLSLVQEDFPDVTISKIRFLESQGLLDPERTPSGYRKFYDTDIERLEWILAQQRDNFLPLKVIRERLDEWDATGTRPDPEQQTPSTDDLPASAVAGTATGAEDTSNGGGPRRAASTLAASSAMEVMSGGSRPGPGSAAVPSPGPTPGGEAEHGSEVEPLVGPPSTALTADELAARCDVSVAVVDELESYGMIDSRRIGPDTYFDPGASAIVEACRQFLDNGVEVRHLRMYKIAAEREAGVFEQLVMPLLKQRNPEARSRAVETVNALADAGEALHAALLRKVLSDTLP
ncbi:MAG: MerR family DNA-binding transcriptional regulator [Acidimicrobiales bacterium]|nr:MerR family DNA-binding transcriptional regulator [Acidimicrobiales bacterium]